MDETINGKSVPAAEQTATPEQWINELSKFDRDNEIVALCMIIAFGYPKSYLDVGSGTGAMVNAFDKLGVSDVNGLDILPRPAHSKLFQVDLRYPQFLGRKYQLVSSIETAEHIEPEFSDVFLDTITRHAEERIIFTAAMPGQRGLHHVNCLPSYTWRDKFYERGWQYSPEDTYRLALFLSNAKQALHHIESNMQIFRPK